MKKLLLLPLAAGLLFVGACGRDNFRDLKNVKSHDPDSAVVYTNVDGNPNITKLCIEGVGFATTTRDYTSVMRVPEWDAGCKAVQK